MYLHALKNQLIPSTELLSVTNLPVYMDVEKILDVFCQRGYSGHCTNLPQNVAEFQIKISNQKELKEPLGCLTLH